jgi:hypothetical protein
VIPDQPGSERTLRTDQVPARRRVDRVPAGVCSATRAR